jgi:hypothetical protein
MEGAIFHACLSSDGTKALQQVVYNTRPGVPTFIFLLLSNPLELGGRDENMK